MFAGLCLAGTLAHAQAAAIAPGEYEMGGSWGTLIVAPQEAGDQRFSIASSGVNGNQYSLEGALRGLRAEVKADEGGEKCVIGFAMEDLKVTVNPITRSACRTFCGMRAWFDGTYASTPPGCTVKEIGDARAAFQQSYAKKEYAQAQLRLAPLLEHCKESISECAEARYRNDLAVTLYHLGQRAQCRATLESLAYLADSSDEDLTRQYFHAPGDGAAWVTLARATRTNLKLCGSSRRK